MPAYAFPLIGGLAVILIFCFMIGLLIMEPGTKERLEKQRLLDARRRANSRMGVRAQSSNVQTTSLATQSMSMQGVRPEHEVSGN